MASEVPEPLELPLSTLRALEETLLERFFAGVPAIRPLPPAQAHAAARKQLAEARGAREIEAALRERGLVRGLARARAYAPFAHTLGRPKLIAIVPYTSADPKSSYVGAIGLSEGEPANGIVVQVDGNRVTRFTSLDFMEGKFSEKEFVTDELIRAGTEKLVERKRRGNVPPDIEIEDSAAIGSNAFQVLLHDEHSRAVHSPEDLQALIHNAPIVTTIAELQHMRLRGLSASPDVSCCSCCCCCWGCCSCCSAVASSYVSESYFVQAPSEVLTQGLTRSG
jgi:hypothetical protein